MKLFTWHGTDLVIKNRGYDVVSGWRMHVLCTRGLQCLYHWGGGGWEGLGYCFDRIPSFCAIDHEVLLPLISKVTSGIFLTGRNRERLLE